MGFVPSALAAPAAAGTVIGNQAVATFESGGQTFSVTSNLVQTTINTIAGVQIETDTIKSAVAGGSVFFPHTVTNVGNAADSYDLSIGSLGSGLTAAGIYSDGDCDGVPDTLTAISKTSSLNAGESTCVVARIDVGASATDSPTFKITAASTLTTAANYQSGSPARPNASNTDTVNVTTGAVLAFTKNMTLLEDLDGSRSVTPGDRVRVRFNYSNTGGSDAQNVAIFDQIPAELVYVAGSGKWSDGGTMADAEGAADHTNGQGQTIAYSVGADKVTATVSSVPVGRSGYIEFTTTVTAGAVGTIENTGTIDSDQTDLQTSNVARLVVDDGYSIAVTLADRAAGTSYADRPTADLPDNNYAAGGRQSSTDQDGLANDAVADVETPYLSASSPVLFEVIITNQSNTAQRFDLSAVAGSFPSGTTFTFASTSEGTALLDTTSDGRPDIEIAANTVAAFWARAHLPDGAARNAGQEPAWEATMTATPANKPGAANSTRLRVESAVGGGTVDLQNENGKAQGAEVASGGAPWTTVSTDPGKTAEFTLVVVNRRSVSDSFNLSYSGSNFAPGSMPDGWQVVFLNAGGDTVTNTGVIAAGSSATFTARVTPPGSARPGSTDVYFRASSASSASAVDTKLDRVTVSRVADLAIRSDQSAEAAPGGVVVISHTLENLGNVAVTGGAIGYDPAFPSFVETLWVDKNGNGVLDGADVQVAGIADINEARGAASFAPGESVLLFSRVQAPASAVGGLSETAKVVVGGSLTESGGAAVADANTANNAVTETVTVVSGNVVVSKEQALDAACDGAPDGNFTQAAQAANPGACIVYRVTAANVGAADANEVRIDDEVPAYTTYVGSSAAAAGGSLPAVALQPADGEPGALRSSHGTVNPGGTARLTFRVKIDE
ncbi:DUF11 domain-containing protein [Mesorhizobium plurifarium]|uniref:DUF11 domain-containing protein n=1 Tax=Sinorhizobium arboris TaxID=76745 RepID=UPI00041456EC|nr:DUF11 domain-containing protein [Sinorhizobium arboris]PST27161.1 DUF11 domain-containing protein [Mesorhizobium plurifarium]